MPVWITLREAATLPRERVGAKAQMLGRLLRDGAPVLDGFVLPSDATVDAAAASAELKQRAPDIAHWILRSSSPLEDQLGQSAAGLFQSVTAPANELPPALRTVLASASGELAQRILHAQAPLAVLAQEHRVAQRWLTVEARADQPLELEGWRTSALDRAPLVATELEALRRELQSLSRWFTAEADWPGALLELLHDGERWWILQKRPSPSVAMPRAEAWQLDYEHSIHPLCPLLNDLFVEANTGGNSQLREGRWYVQSGSRTPPSESEAQAALHDSLAKLASLTDEVERWREKLASVAGDPSAWRSALQQWLRLHADYFARPTATLRAWLEAHPAPRGALASSLAQRRGAELAALRAHGRDASAELLERCGHLSLWPWDGRGRSVWEEPSLLWQFAAATDAKPAEALAGLGSQIARHLEDDDDVLARLYACLRLSLRALWQQRVGELVDWEGALELRPSELWRQLERFDAAAFAQQLADGRARAQAWKDAALPGPAVGLGIVPGRVRGPACVRAHALAGGLPPAGCILVVPAISPFDAVAFGRIAGLVVEAGERLSHAAILAREHGVPTLLGVPGACERWRGAKTLDLDATLATLVSI